MRELELRDGVPGADHVEELFVAAGDPPGPPLKPDDKVDVYEVEDYKKIFSKRKLLFKKKSPSIIPFTGIDPPPPTVAGPL